MFLCIGYASTSGVYALMSVEDRQKKMRYILSINGIKGASYWFGMFLADYILFLLPTLLFVIFILIIQLSGFE